MIDQQRERSSRRLALVTPLRVSAPDYEYEPPLEDVVDRVSAWLIGDQCWTLIGRGDLRVLHTELMRLRALNGEPE
jgi:hypothetical protein